jgi:hypothetical protein
MCNAAKECKPLDSTVAAVAAASGSASAGPPPPVEKETWDVATPDQQKKCLATCKLKRDECKKRCGAGPTKPKK